MPFSIKPKSVSQGLTYGLKPVPFKLPVKSTGLLFTKP